MFIKMLVKKVLGRRLNIQIVKNPDKGISLVQDIQCFLPELTLRNVLDVGANVGDFALEIQYWFPGTIIDCFEPASTTCEVLIQNTRKFPNISAYNVALGNTHGSASFIVDNTTSVMSRIVTDQKPVETGEEVTTVEMNTVDRWCASQGIDSLSLLKIDTEGFDLAVAMGAEGMLERGAISLVQLECGLSPDNELHVPFESIKQYMESHHYRLFGMYEQVHEWISRKPNLRRVNAVFMSPRLLS